MLGVYECKVHFSKIPVYAMRAKTGWDLKRNQQYYFEVTIQKEVQAVGIGLVDSDFPLIERMPGIYTFS